MKKITILLCSLTFCTLLVSHTVYSQADNDDDDEFDDAFVTEEVEQPPPEASDYTSPVVDPTTVHFAEHFDDIDKFNSKWVLSQAKKDGADEQIAKYDGEWKVEAPQRVILKDDLGLVLKSKVKHAAISARLDKPFVFNDKPLVVQYEVTMQEGQECGGSYIKLLSSGKETNDLKQFHDKTPYTIMFGPDKCGNDHKLHFIFRHKNPVNGTLEEKHCKKPNDRLEDPFKDKKPHLYTLIVRPDNTFSVLLDSKEINSGSLLEDFTPAVNPPEKIDDPNDFKPAGWDDREKIPDPTATKPLDWDETAPPQVPDPQAAKPDGWLDNEPEMIPDPEAEKPADWDVEMDGEWEAQLIENPKCAEAPGCGKWSAPLITNPHYKGVWRAPLINNPQYQGKWSPNKIRNPHFFRDENPFKMTPISAIGIELWSMSSSLLFDNIIITDDEEVASEWAKQSFTLKVDTLSSQSATVIDVIIKATNDYPWLWAVYVLIVGVIACLLFYCLCGPSSSQENDELKEKAKLDAEIKKTDAIVEDDQPAEIQNEPEEEAGSQDDDAEDEEENEEDEEEEEAAEKPEEYFAPSDVKDNLNVPENSADAPRRRKPRKE